jgi:hypothetical protein
MRIRYYMMCFRFEALVASHLEPEEFGIYMAVGTKKLASGKVMFFEVDPFPRPGAVEPPYFRLDDIETRCAPRPDGGPKRSKYISVYRVLEHLSLEQFGALYLTTSDGRVLKLDDAPWDGGSSAPAGSSIAPSAVNLYQELCPLLPMVVSTQGPDEFLRGMTDPRNPVSAPRLLIADLRLNRDVAGHLAGDLPYTDARHIEECVRELEQDASKPSKTVSRTPRTQGFFRVIRRGFFLGDSTGLKFYRFPTVDELEIHHAGWWRSAQMA